MAEHQLPMRIQLRYDTYQHWMNSDTILKAGEVAIATMPTRNSLVNTNITPENTPPAVGIKVGDGLRYFDELPWLQGIAADVYNWAKSSSKPTYAASEIQGLADYIATYGGGGGSGAASSAYRIYYDTSTSKYILQQYDEEQEDWIASSGAEIDVSTILSRLTTIENWANGARTQLGNIELPLTAFVYDEVVNYLNRLDVTDTAVAHQFVTAVNQVDGKVQITRSILSAADIQGGVLPTEYGGTGFSSVEADELLVGSASGDLVKRTFVTEIDSYSRSSFATVGAIIDYIAEMTEGLTGAMHFIGEATVAFDISSNPRLDPQIPGYALRYAQVGDVILANNAQEYVWTGSEWRLLGDEGSYAVKGSITNADIASEANIDQSKISGLIDALLSKVDKVEGKTLSSNDYTDTDKSKLEGIDDGAQVNAIEHVFVNETEVVPATVSGQPKSIALSIPDISDALISKLEDIEEGAQANTIEHVLVNGVEVNPATINNQRNSVNIEFIPYTDTEQTKLAGIEAGAQVNILESISINGVAYTADGNKNIDITLDQAALNLNVIAGAQVPGSTVNTIEDVSVTRDQKLELARIAKTGNVRDLQQTAAEYVTFYCGSSTDVI